ncbi:MAG: toxin HicA [Chloroflexi bacterium]|nr:toxin HicA [Chloroflexota bacterium]
MPSIQNIIAAMKRNPKGVSYSDLCKVCDHYFGEARQSGSSHRIYKTPWPGDPRVNIQNDRGMAKAYQVKQVLKAVERLTALNEDEEVPGDVER